MNRILAVVLACHFLAAFTVLGMPMYMPLLFSDLGLAANSPWVGVLFAWPALLTALSGPLWGRFADRFGRRVSLVRALAGLSLAFVGVGLSRSMAELVIAMTLQGVMGGTLAAANSYLATAMPRQTLAASLNWTQSSARLALLVAPLGLAIGIQYLTLQQLYLVLAALPLAGCVFAFTLPKDQPRELATAQATLNTPEHKTSRSLVVPVYALQALFCFAMVVTFPYFLPYAAPAVKGHTAIALLYVLPHLVYLVAQVMLKTRLPDWFFNARLAMLFIAVAALLQWQFNQPWALAGTRFLMGTGIWLGYHGMHQLASQSFPMARAGFWFGSLDGAGKLAGVVAGIAAGFAVAQLSLAAPFLLSAVACFIAMPLIFHIQKTGQHPCTSTAISNKPFNNIKPNTTA